MTKTVIYSGEIYWDLQAYKQQFAQATISGEYYLITTHLYPTDVNICGDIMGYNLHN
jgi:hypothetical protein